MSAKDRLASLGLVLPEPPAPAGAYTRAVRAGDLIFLAGQLPIERGKVTYVGKVGSTLSVEEGYDACRLCALNALSILEVEAGGLESVRIVRMTGFVCSAEGFTDQPKVVNGASELMSAVLEERGIHSRLAIGVAELPLGAAVELEVIAEITA
jgi:enamine deaminase RidA (YjgF/YER057c/UK114 family)